MVNDIRINDLLDSIEIYEHRPEQSLYDLSIQLPKIFFEFRNDQTIRINYYTYRYGVRVDELKTTIEDIILKSKEYDKGKNQYIKSCKKVFYSIGAAIACAGIGLGIATGTNPLSKPEVPELMNGLLAYMLIPSLGVFFGASIVDATEKTIPDLCKSSIRNAFWYIYLAYNAPDEKLASFQ